MADYFSFEDVLHELDLGEDELKRMVSEGELRAFRDENKMKFKKEDVENLKKGRVVEPTIILPSTPSQEDSTAETALDLNIDAEAAALSESTEPAIDLGDEKAGGPSIDDSDLIVTTDEPSTVGSAEETFLEEDTGLTTEPLGLADETAPAETQTVIAEAGRRRGPSSRTRVTAGVPTISEEELERSRAGPVWTFLMVVALIASLAASVFFYDFVRIQGGLSHQPAGLTAGSAHWILEQFWGDKEWTKFHQRRFPESGAKQPPFKDEAISYPDKWYLGPSFDLPDIPPKIEPSPEP